MKVLVYFARAYSDHTAVVVVCLFVVGLLEALGLSAALPVLGYATAGSEAAAEATGYAGRVLAALDRMGVPRDLEPLVGVMLTAFVLKGAILMYANGRIGFMVAQLATDLRLRLLRALLGARWSYYTRLPVGVPANALATEATRASQSFLFASQSVTLALEACVAGGVAVAVSWQAVLAIAVAGVISLSALQSFVGLAERAGRSQTRLLEDLLRRITDTLQSAKLLKATGREALVGPLLEEDTEGLNRALKKKVLGIAALTTLQEPIMIALASVALLVAVGRFQMPAADAVLIILLMARTLSTINKAQRAYQAAKADESALWSLLATIEDAEGAREDLSGDAPPSLSKGIVLRNVHFDYGDREVLDDLSLEIPAGGITAIVGASGAGKSTLVDLITGLASPHEGSILIDGTELSTVDLLRWRHTIGYVPQETLLLHDSVRNNVTLGDHHKTDADIEKALRGAGAWEFIAKLPEGLDTSVGERGALLSGGQRQRIAIARALLHEPRLLILDEATAALDRESEAGVWATVASLRGQTTVLAISHQPALTDVADRIYRIEDGTATLVVTPSAVADLAGS